MMITEKNRAAYRLFLKREHRVNNEESRAAFADRYRGAWAGRAAYTRDFYESNYDMDELPEWARGFLDWTKLAKELFSTDLYAIENLSGYIVYVFSNN